MVFFTNQYKIMNVSLYRLTGTTADRIMTLVKTANVIRTAITPTEIPLEKTPLEIIRAQLRVPLKFPVHHDNMVPRCLRGLSIEPLLSRGAWTSLPFNIKKLSESSLRVTTVKYQINFLPECNGLNHPLLS